MTSVNFITQGCPVNQAYTEQMKGLLNEARFEILESLEDSDIVIFNTCSVKNSSESAFLKNLQEIKQNHPYKILIIAGCIVQTNQQLLEGYSLVGTRQIHKIVEVVEEALNDNVVKMIEFGEMPPLALPKIRENPIVEIIPLNWGCLSLCPSYKTKLISGDLKSYPVEEILSAAKKAVDEGVKEIWLASQDTMCYGFDLGTSLASLLQELIKIPGKFKIKVGMGSPVHLKKVKDQLFPLLNHEKIFKFLHVPVQTGSDKVLKDMDRGNTKEEFLNLVEELKNTIPRITLATDITVGFPSETEDDYWETLEVVKKTTPDVINISKFWARSGTSAAEMEQLPEDVTMHRSKVITDILHNVSKIQNEKWVGWEGEVIIDDKGHEDKQWIGRNDYYKLFVLEGDFKLGDIINVKAVKADILSLRGKII